MGIVKSLIVTFFCLLCSISSFAQSETETARPTLGVSVERHVFVATIEKQMYFDVVVELKAAALGDMFADGVKIIVKDAKTGKTIYKKRFSSSYLYGFSNGSLQVEKGNILTQLIVYKQDNKWMMTLREKGIY